MFENLISRLNNFKTELERIDGKSISVSISADADGYYDKECPNSNCMFPFKVYSEDWTNIFKDEKVFCPMCKHEAEAKQFRNSVQFQRGKEQVLQQMRKSVLSAWQGNRIEYHSVHIPALNEMKLKIQCAECQARYSVIGSAFFCPSCGNNSVEKTFDESLSKVEIKLNNIPVVRKAIEEVSKDEAEVTCRSLIETALNDCVVAFQRFCEATYLKEKPSEKIPVNVFQRLEDGSKLWREIFNEGYEDWLSVTELTRMNTLFQRRHLLSHTEGLVDEKYLQRANDLTYRLGQRIVVKENDVTELLKLIRKVISKIREKRTA